MLLTLRDIWGNPFDLPVYSPDAAWNDVGGIYAFLHVPTDGGSPQVPYIGETHSFSQRLPGHEKWLFAVWGYGANAIAAAPVAAAVRKQLERTLIVANRPPMNDEYVPRSPITDWDALLGNPQKGLANLFL